MKFKTQTLYIDKHNTNIYFFISIDDQTVEGMYWTTNPSTLNSGMWNKSSWDNFFKKTKNRFDLLKNHTLTKPRKRRMIQQLFEVRLKV